MRAAVVVSSGSLRILDDNLRFQQLSLAVFPDSHKLTDQGVSVVPTDMTKIYWLLLHVLAKWVVAIVIADSVLLKKRDRVQMLVFHLGCSRPH